MSATRKTKKRTKTRGITALPVCGAPWRMHAEQITDWAKRYRAQKPEWRPDPAKFLCYAPNRMASCRGFGIVWVAANGRENEYPFGTY